MTDYERIKAAFQVFDADGNGQLSAAELRAILSRGDGLLSAVEIDEVIHAFDTNDDGMLNIHEFAAACADLSDEEAAAVEARVEEAKARADVNSFGGAEGNPFDGDEVAAGGLEQTASMLQTNPNTNMCSATMGGRCQFGDDGKCELCGLTREEKGMQ